MSESLYTTESEYIYETVGPGLSSLTDEDSLEGRANLQPESTFTSLSSINEYENWHWEQRTKEGAEEEPKKEPVVFSQGDVMQPTLNPFLSSVGVPVYATDTNIFPSYKTQTAGDLKEEACFFEVEKRVDEEKAAVTKFNRNVYENMTTGAAENLKRSLDEDMKQMKGSIKKKIGMALDVDIPAGNNWQVIAEELNVPREAIRLWDSKNDAVPMFSPTEHMFKHLTGASDNIPTVRNLHKVCIEYERYDVVRVINEYYDLND
ncbi:uncharacterized protein [Antedon mediterranea]|uniref:uncharacterized protein n=1 Tax=Antedon mediterranea TaxID=105859 RepID=UPI003AF70D5C